MDLGLKEKNGQKKIANMWRQKKKQKVVFFLTIATPVRIFIF